MLVHAPTTIEAGGLIQSMAFCFHEFAHNVDTVAPFHSLLQNPSQTGVLKGVHTLNNFAMVDLMMAATTIAAV